MVTIVMLMMMDMRLITVVLVIRILMVATITYLQLAGRTIIKINHVSP